MIGGQIANRRNKHPSRLKGLSTPPSKSSIILGMIVTTEIGTRQLAELIKQVQAGDEVLLTQDSKPVARLVAASTKPAKSRNVVPVRSIPGHRVLIPNVSQGELADEMFNRP
jgi:antitoxin (DNA-binding transcriptional repressor) of toxin-antitoxin stability system